MMGQLVIPALCGILFVLVIGSSEDAFAELKTCNGYTGLWTDAAAWSPPGQPASTDTLSITNCNLTIPAGTDVLIEEGLPPAGIDFLLQPAYALELVNIDQLLLDLEAATGSEPAASFTADIPNNDMSVTDSFINSLGDGPISITAAAALIDGLTVSAPSAPVTISVQTGTLPGPLDIEARELNISDTILTDVGFGAAPLRLAAQRHDISNTSFMLSGEEPRTLPCLDYGPGPPTPASAISNTSFDLSSGASVHFFAENPSSLPLELSDVTFDLDSTSSVMLDAHSNWTGNNFTAGAGIMIFGSTADTNIESGTTTFGTRTDIHGNLPNFFHNSAGAVVRIDSTLRNFGDMATDGTVHVDTNESFIVFGSYTVSPTGTHNNNANGFTKIKNGGIVTVDNGGVVNNIGKNVLQTGSIAAVSGTWNEMAGTPNDVFGAFSVENNGNYNNQAGSATRIGTGGSFDVKDGGTVTDQGSFITLAGQTTTVSGTFNEQSSASNTIAGTFRVAANGVYSSTSSGLTKVTPTGTFEVKLDGTENNAGKHVTQTGGTTTIESGGTENNSGEYVTQTGAFLTLTGEWNEQSNTNTIFGTYTVENGAIYDNEAGGNTRVGSGGAFNIDSGGTVNNLGDFFTRAGATTTLTGLWNELSGNTNTISGIFNVASGGVYDNEANGKTKVTNAANFNLQQGGKVNNFDLFVVQTGGTATLDDEYDNNSGAKTYNFGTMNLDCNGMFNDLGGNFGGTAIVDICPANYCSGTASCFAGVVTDHIDGDTLDVDGDPIRFALVDAPEIGETGGQEAADFIATACPVGTVAIVDEDDGQTGGSFGRMIAVVYCIGSNLNEDILDEGLATIATSFCSVSEFGTHTWAQNHGC